MQSLLTDHFAAFRALHGVSLPQLKAVSRLKLCRTAALGAHVQCCPHGHIQGVWYNSCKHRACPQCCALPQERWLRRLSSVLLDCPHHHMIFTLPAELHPLWRFNRERFAELLFAAVHRTLQTFGADPKYLAAMPGVISCLHTWGRDLSLHPHVHCLLTHGGLNDAGDWVLPRKSVLFPQKPLMLVYRGKLLAALRRALLAGELVVPPDRSLQQCLNLCNQLGRKAWVVHCCQRYDHASGVAKYLARYIKGGPLRNSQLLSVSPSQVRFRYQSHRTHGSAVAQLTMATFIQRWLEHVPTPGKASIRYLGLYSSGGRRKLNLAREHFAQAPVSLPALLSWQHYIARQWPSAGVCKACGQPLGHGVRVRPLRAPR
mgnify:FL=1